MVKANIILRITFVAVFAALGIVQYYRYHAAPDFPVGETRLQYPDGKVAQLPDDRFVLVSFFQTWCRDCVAELPHIRNLVSKTGSEKLQVILISDEDNEKLEKFRNRWKVDFPILKPAGKTFSDLGIRVYPSTYLLSPSGKVLMSKTEGYDWANEEIVRLIK
jgi:peroxiredoxin